MRSIKYNFAWNLIGTICSTLFPMITVPYLSRVLQPEGVGKIAFADSFIQYFIIFASVGMSFYGLREIAKVKNNSKKLSQTLSELLFVNLIMTIIAYLIFLFFLIISDKIQDEKNLLIILSFNIIFTVLGIEWYYQGTENYNYITKRSILVKVACIVSMFLFVKNKNDYLISALITVIGTVGSNTFNIWKAKDYISVSKMQIQNITKRIKPILIAFSLVVISQITVPLTTFILGCFHGYNTVAFFSSSYKLAYTATLLIVPLGNVIIPRATFLISKGYKADYQILIQKLFSFNLFISFPIIIMFVIFSEFIITLFLGVSFISVNLPMKILATNILIAPMSYMFLQQVLYPNNDDRKVIYSLIAGSVCNIILNILLIPAYSYIGASISIVLSNFCTLIFSFFYSLKYVGFYYLKNTVIYIGASFILLLFFILIEKYANNIFFFCIFTITGLLIYTFLLIILREKIIIPAIFTHIRKILNFNRKII